MKAWNRIDLTGHKYNSLLVLEESERKGYWLCQCDCGKNKVVYRGSLRSGNSKSCGHCGRKAHNWCGYGEISGSYWSHFKHNAKLKNRIVEISIEEAWQVFINQNRKCAISGMELSFAKNYIKNPSSQDASLDRKDSNSGYVIDNVQWVHKVVNKIKNTLSDEELISWCKVIYDHNKLS